jgi:hypothetical protein
MRCSSYCLHHESIIAMQMEAVVCPETSVYISQSVRRDFPKDLKLLTPCTRTLNRTGMYRFSRLRFVRFHTDADSILRSSIYTQTASVCNFASVF